MERIDWLLTCLRSVIGQKDIINVFKHKYQRNNKCVVRFILIFSSHPVIIIFFVLIITRLLKIDICEKKSKLDRLSR